MPDWCQAPILARPAWYALKGRQSQFAIGGDRALRYAADVAPFAATVDDSDASLKALGTLIAEHGNVVLLQLNETPVPPGTALVMRAEGVQMVAQSIVPLEPDARVTRLGAADVPAMLALTELTKPGPFKTRTHQLGNFWGVKEGGHLLAMAGERMQFEGYTEVSGVCTHPSARGRGFAGMMSRVVATQIMQRGETPILHAYANNAPAIRLYEALGFKLRAYFKVMVLAPAT